MIVTAALAWGAGSLHADASFEDLYGEQSRVVRWARSVGDQLRRPDTLELELVATGERPVLTSESLRAIETTARRLGEIEGLGPSRSLADPVSLVNQLANDDDPFWLRVPGRNDDIEEIVEKLAERDPEALARWLGDDRQHTRISVEAEKLPQEDLRRVMSGAHEILRDGLPEGWTYTLTGPVTVVHEMIDEIQRTQLTSFAAAGVIVLSLVGIFLRSARLAGLAAVPTLLPVLATLGAMGWSGAPLDVGSAMVAAVVIGIAVDDCIHLLSVYQRLRHAGQRRAKAMRHAVLRVGRALVTTSIALALGFFALTLSSWSTIANFGALAGVAILGALFAVIALLPAGLMEWGGD